jgi:hypothetical protein
VTARDLELARVTSEHAPPERGSARKANGRAGNDVRTMGLRASFHRPCRSNGARRPCRARQGGGARRRAEVGPLFLRALTADPHESRRRRASSRAGHDECAFPAARRGSAAKSRRGGQSHDAFDLDFVGRLILLLHPGGTPQGRLARAMRAGGLVSAPKSARLARQGFAQRLEVRELRPAPAFEIHETCPVLDPVASKAAASRHGSFEDSNT